MAEAKTVLTADTTGFTSDMLKAEKSVVDFGNSMEKQGSKATTLKGALRQATKEAMDLSLQMSKMSDVELSSDIGQQMQAQFQMAMQAAADYKDQVGDIQQEISNMASDTKAWDAVSQGIGVVSSSMQGLAGVIGLAGGDVKAFTQALTVMNTVQSVANTIIGIGNALQSQSALMVGLRAAKNAIFGTTMVAATAAETANTAAVGANTVAQGANTAETTAATTAQWALNAAVLANPYVACAVAIAALVGGLALWISSMDEATDSEIALGAAVDAFSEQVDSAMKAVGEQINLYDDLKRQYDACGGKTDEFSKKLIANTDVQKKLGVTVKTVDDVHKLFAKNSDKYRQAAMARASAMAAEAAQAALLGATLAELSKIQAKLMAGQEVDWVDMRKVVESMGYSADKADQLMKNAGYVYESDGWGYGDIKKGTGDLTKLVQGITSGGAYKALQDMGDQFKDTFDTINEIDFGGILTSNLNALDSGLDKTGKNASKAGKSASNSAKKTNDEIKKVLTSLEGCDAIIQQAEKDMKKLDSTSADYEKNMQSLKNTILMARIAKLALIDKSSLSGLSDARKLIEQIIQSLPPEHERVKELRNALKDVDDALYDIYSKVAESGDLKSMKEARSQIEKIIETLPEGSEELQKWIDRWIELNGKITASEERIKNLKQGIQEGSKLWLEQQIKELQSEIDKLPPTLENLSKKTDLELKIEFYEGELGKWNEMMNGALSTGKRDAWWNELVNVDWISMSQDANQERLTHTLEEEKEYLSYLKEIKRTEVSPEKWDETQKAIKEANEEITRFEKLIAINNISDAIADMNSELNSTTYDSIKGGVDVLRSMYDVASSLPDKLDNCSNAVEGFFVTLEAGFSILDSILSFIDTIQHVIDLMGGLVTAKQALGAVTDALTTSEIAEQVATDGEVAAVGVKAGADAEAAAASGAKIAAAKAEESAMLDLAAANIFAAHSYIPFAGVGIASGFVATMLAEMASVHASAMGLQALAGGGIVQGSTTVGDRVFARLNAGEAVLNQRQQARLFKLIDHGEVYGDGPIASTVRVKGSDLYIALKNYSKVTGKTSLGNIGVR